MKPNNSARIHSAPGELSAWSKKTKGARRKRVASVELPLYLQSISFEAGRMELTLPSHVKLRVRRGLVWRRVLPLTGAVLCSNEITLSLDSKKGIEIEDQSVRFTFSPSIAGAAALHETVKSHSNYRPFVVSAIVHSLLLCLVLWERSTAPRTSGLSQLGVKASKEKVEKIESQGQAGSSARPQRVRIPFGGISFTQYLDRREIMESPEKQVENLMGSLKGLKLENRTGSTGQAASGLGKGSGVGLAGKIGGGQGTDLRGSLKKAKSDLATQQPASSSRTDSQNLSDEERRVLRQRFNDLRDDMQKIYARALMSDPDFNVTLTFEAVLQPSGKFRVASLRSDGKYRGQSLNALETGLRNLVSDIPFNKAHAGLVIKHQHVYVR